MKSQALAAALALAAAQTSPAGQDWNTYHGGHSLDGVADAVLPDDPARLWEFKAGAPVEVPPVSEEGRIFVATTKGILLALDTEGRQLWSVALKDDAFSSPPMAAEKAVFVGTDKGFLHAYDAATGREKWSFKVGDTVMGSANKVDLGGGRKGIIVISQADGVMHCLDPATGKPHWSLDKIDRCDGSPSVGGGKIVWGSCAAAIHIVNLSERNPKREDIPLGEDGQVAGGVALACGTAYAGTYGGRAFAADVAKRAVSWNTRISTGEAFATPAAGEKIVVFGSSNGKVCALDRRTGAKAWEFDTGGAPSSPVLAGGRLLVSSAGSILMLDAAEGRKIWSARVSDSITGPAVIGGLILVGTDSGVVAAFGRRQAPR